MARGQSLLLTLSDRHLPPHGASVCWGPYLPNRSGHWALSPYLCEAPGHQGSAQASPSQRCLAPLSEFLRAGRPGRSRRGLWNQEQGVKSHCAVSPNGRLDFLYKVQLMVTATVLGLRRLNEIVRVSRLAGHVVNTRKRGALLFRGLSSDYLVG